MYRSIIGVAVALGLGACASVPMASTDVDAEGKRFAPPPPDQGALYIYRESIFGAAATLSITVGQRALGALSTDTWFRIDVPPGTYDIRCTGGEGSDSRLVQLASGETRYVEAAIRMGVLQPRCAVFEVAADKGRPAILNGKRAREIQ